MSEITIPAGTEIVTVPGTRGVVKADTVIVFDTEHDQTAECLAAAGRTDLLPFFAHETTIEVVDDKGKPAKVPGRVVYTPLGRRIEQTIEHHEAAKTAEAEEAKRLENEALGSPEEQAAVAEQKAAEEKAAADKIAAEEKRAADQKAATEKAAAEKKAVDEAEAKRLAGLPDPTKTFGKPEDKKPAETKGPGA